MVDGDSFSPKASYVASRQASLLLRSPGFQKHEAVHVFEIPFESLVFRISKKHPTAMAVGCFLLIVPRQGFEPRFLGPKPSVLPLDDLGIGSRASIA